MLTELRGKGGCVCQPAKEGKLRCPLIIRPTSEDVITGNLFQTLQAINPRWWLPDLINNAVGADRQRRQIFRGLKIQLWKNFQCYPRELLPWNEGSTQVDAVITWENPPTTVFVEMKYLSEPATKVAAGEHHAGYPTDQIIRNIRVGLLHCGWFKEDALFDLPRRDFMLLLISPTGQHPLIEKYRCPETVRKAIPHSDRLRGLPRGPFVGGISYAAIGQVLERNRWSLCTSETTLLKILQEYLDSKC